MRLLPIFLPMEVVVSSPWTDSSAACAAGWAHRQEDGDDLGRVNFWVSPGTPGVRACCVCMRVLSLPWVSASGTFACKAKMGLL